MTTLTDAEITRQAAGRTAVKVTITGDRMFSDWCVHLGSDLRLEDAEWAEEHAPLYDAAPAMLAALEAIEWRVSTGDWNRRYCPLCGNPEFGPHMTDCKIGNALSQARGEA